MNSRICWRHGVEHVAGEVVEDVTRVARERVDVRARIGILAQGDRSEVETGGPSLRPTGQSLGIVLLQVDAAASEELAGFARRQTELLGAYLCEVTVRAKAGKGKRGIGAARDHDLYRLRRVLDERAHGLVAERVPDEVPVLDDEHERWRVGELLDQQRDRDRHDPQRSRREHLDGVRAGARMDAVKPEDELVPELDGVGVLPVEREPRERHPSRSSACHWPRSVVFPYPAGAQTSVSRRPRPSRRRSTRCCRGTRFGRTRGACSFVSRIKGCDRRDLFRAGGRPSRRSCGTLSSSKPSDGSKFTQDETASGCSSCLAAASCWTS